MSPVTAATTELGADMDRIAKAVIAALAAAYGIYEFATTVDSAGGVGVTSAEWGRVAVFGLIAGLGTWAVPNAPAKAEPAQPVAPVVVPLQSVDNPRYDAQP